MDKNIIVSGKKLLLLLQYCKRNKIGLLVFRDFLIEGKDYYAKKPALHKFLMGSYIEKILKI